MHELDATVAHDDFFCERLHYCVLCGSRPRVLDQVQLDSLVLAAVWCLPCRNRCGGSLAPLIDFLAERYAKERRHGDGP